MTTEQTTSDLDSMLEKKKSIKQSVTIKYTQPITQ